MLYKNCLHVKAKAKKDGETGGRYFAAHAVVQTQQPESCTVARNGCCNYYYTMKNFNGEPYFVRCSLVQNGL